MQNAPTQSYKRVRIPSKLFLMGEYLATQGSPAVVAALPHYFEWYSPEYQNAQNNLVQELKFFLPHDQSPAGIVLNAGKNSFIDKLKRRFDKRDFGFWKDPFQGQGGFGGSTAEYLSSLVIQEKMGPTPIVWSNYRKIFTNKAIKPSGFDLVAQMEGGSGVVRFSKSDDLVYQRLKISSDLCFAVLSASHLEGRKVKTHEHLSQLNPQKLEALKPLKKVVLDFAEALESGNKKRVGMLMREFRSQINQAGLEHPNATKETHLLEQHPSVIGVKGLGALLADGFLVLLNEPSQDFLEFTKKLNLKLIHMGALGGVEGMRVEAFK